MDQRIEGAQREAVVAVVGYGLQHNLFPNLDASFRQIAEQSGLTVPQIESSIQRLRQKSTAQSGSFAGGPASAGTTDRLTTEDEQTDARVAKAVWNYASQQGLTSKFHAEEVARAVGRETREIEQVIQQPSAANVQRR